MSRGPSRSIELSANDRLGQHNLTFPIISLPDQSFPMELAIDPNLTVDMEDDQGQGDWPFTFAPSPLLQPYDTPRISNGILSTGSASTCPTSYYGGCESSSFSYQGSPGHSFTASPSIGQCPATPPDFSMPIFSIRDSNAIDLPQFPHLDPPEVHHGQSGALNQFGAAPGSPFFEPTLGLRYPYGVPLGVSGYPNVSAIGDGKRPISGRIYDEEECDHFGIRPNGAQMRSRHNGVGPEEDITFGIHDGPFLSQDRMATQSASPSSRPPSSFLRNPSIKRTSSDNSNNNNFSIADRKCKRMSSTSASLFASDRRYCQKCKVNFQTAKLLEDHVKTKHARPFICVFHFAGCPARFEAKNEWKRHVSTKHVSLKYWLCLEGNCAQSRGSTTHRRSALLPPLGSIFNRKDLYTQHVKRMHRDATCEDSRDAHGYSLGAGERLKRMQEGALRKRLELPQYMICPVQECELEFRGSNAWNERMEHVAQKHFDYTSPEYRADVGFGGPDDTALTAWASRSDVQIIKKTSHGWRLCEPLKGENDCKRRHGESCDTEFESI